MEAGAVDKVKKILTSIGLSKLQVRADARHRKAKELVQEYVRPNAVTLVHAAS